MIEYYTVEELRQLGCPNGLIMQYITWSKDEINRMLNTHHTLKILREME